MPKKTKPKKARKPKKDTGLITIESPVQPGAKLVIASELADDSIIEGEIMGQVLPHFVYEFQQEGKTVAGLSVKGVNEVVRQLNRNPKSGTKIRIRPEFQRVERDVEYNGEKGVEVWVFAENLVNGESGWGVKFESYMKQSKRGAYKNTFALEKALAKAERNAKRKLIPEVMATKMIQKLIAKDNGAGQNVQQISAPSYETVTTPRVPPVQTTKEESESNILEWVNKTNDGARLIAGLDTLMASKAYSQDFKDKVSALISAKVDRLDSQEK